MNRITAGQLCAMGLIGEAFVIFCTEGTVSCVTAAGYSIGSGILFAAAVPLAEFYRRGGKLCRTVQVLLLLMLIVWGGMLFSMQWKTSRTIYIPYENTGEIAGKFLVSGLIGLVCLYISSSGIKALGRAAVIAAAVGTLCLLAAAAGALKSHEWERLSCGREVSLGGEVLRGLKASGGIAAFAVLLGMQRGGYIRSTAAFFSAKAALSAAILLSALLVTGGIMQLTDFPVVTAAQLSQPFPSQRIDALFLIVFTVYAVFAIAVQTAAASYLMQEIFPGFRRFRNLTAISLMIAAAAAITML